MQDIATQGAVKYNLKARRPSPPGAAHAPRLKLAIDGTLLAVALLTLPSWWLWGPAFGRVALFVSSGASLCIAVVLYRAMRVLRPDIITPRLMVVYAALQLVWIMLIVLLGVPTLIFSTTFGVDIGDHPFRAVLPLLILPFGALCGVGTARFFGGRGRRQTSTLGLVASAPPIIVVYLTFSAALLILYWFAALPGAGAVGYLIRVLSSTMFLVPLLAGMFAQRFPSTRWVWFVALGVNGLIGLATGSRAIALMPAAFYVAGYVLTLQGRKRTRAVVISAALGTIAVLMTGIIGLVRQEIGRGGLDIFSQERISAVAEEAARTLEQGAAARTSIVGDGLMRLVAHTNVVVPVLSPDVVPYRGFEGLGSEIASTARISALAGVSAEEFYEAGLGSAPAVAYGFMVNELTSVEFGVLPDGWSRGGPLVVLLFGYLLAWGYIAAEAAVRRVFARDTGAILLSLVVIARSAFFDASGLTLLATFRSLVFGLAFVAVIIALLNALSNPQRGLIVARRS